MNMLKCTDSKQHSINRKLQFIILPLLIAPAVAYANPVVLIHPLPQFLMLTAMLLPAILVEVIIETMILRNQRSRIRTALILFLMNCITVSLLCLLLLRVGGPELWPAILIGETVIMLVEFLFFRIMFRCAYSRCLIASIVGNIASFLCGFLSTLLVEVIFRAINS